MCSLSYINKGASVDIRLKYPSSMISLSIEKVTITNLNQCVNLVNLYSTGNKYSD